MKKTHDAIFWIVPIQISVFLFNDVPVSRGYLKKMNVLTDFAILLNSSYSGIISSKDECCCPVHSYIEPVPPTDNPSQVSRSPNEPAHKPCK